MGEKGYKKLVVWQKADDLAFKIYMATKSFPKDELYGITSQLRRAALSVPTNLVEGSGRQGRNELRQFTNIALGSLAEVVYLLDFSLRLGYLKQEDYGVFQNLHEEIGRLLWKFYKSL
jgi:four helix bundle protein